MASVMTNFPRAKVSINRIMEVIEKEVSIRDGEGSESSVDDAPAVSFSHVSFCYPHGKGMALSDINFEAKKGETVALIGATGSGKTSILNLIPRLFDATEGVVKVNGVDVRKYRLRDLRNLIGYVPQKSYLFSRTIARNIGYGNNGRFAQTLERIQEAARVGQADEFIRNKDGGYDHEVTSGGDFSGGQKQRLTISRAIARDPELYLFDDSFSALDYKTDRTLRKELKKTAGDATVIVVAQRISTIRGADKIIVLDEGRIVGEGTHDRLMKDCSIYREIAASQGVDE
ncbi:MAG: ABC transporter ATP-binding protein/permease [Lachnospiraceae bacterium]|nr:ABC transporter ATP-binding protein/permease [Lachnospiraceae bacterium]